MSEIKVNKISPRTACGTTTLGDSGDTFTIPAGVTITNNGTAAGFGATGAASWDTTVKTTGFTAVSGVGYFVNTTAGAITVTLPLSPAAGAVVAVSDYAGTADTNAITIGRNGSNINGAAADLTVSFENSAVTLVYVDGTQGWKATDTSNLNDIALQPAYVTATGGTITTSGDYKIHTFTGPGTFCVSALGNPVGGPNNVDYMVGAGGGGGGWCIGGGGGAGGIRASSGTASGCYSAGPIASCVSALPVSVQGYSIVVGAGGGGASGNPAPTNAASGGVSTFSSITSAGGGGGGTYGRSGNSGGSGSGAGGWTSNGTDPGSSAGTGNTPPVSPSQGNNGGFNSINTQDSNGAGGGGATASGANSTSNPSRTHIALGGAGNTTVISGTPATYGTGGNGQGDSAPAAAPAAANSSGGGEGAGTDAGGNGGSGIVIIRYKFQN